MIFADKQSCVNIAQTAQIINSRIVIKGNSHITIGDGAVLKNVLLEIEDSDCVVSNVYMNDVNCFCKNNTNVNIASDVNIEHYDIMLNNAILIIAESCILNQGRNALRPYFNIANGKVSIAEKNVICADFWVRFGGSVQVGKYNCINERTELRSDESIIIGDYNMISYECNIWDTNTHCMYDKEKRREVTRNMFPLIGGEFERPKTKPIQIGSDCWIGKKALLLKGTILEDRTIVGVGVTVSNQTIHYGKKAIAQKAIEVD